MKIFFLVSRIPWPLEKGDKLRAYHQLKGLAENNEVHLCCLSDCKPHPEALEQLRKITPHVHFIKLGKIKIAWRLLLATFSDKPYQVHYFFQSAAAGRIRKLIAAIHPDQIYCQLIRTSEYVKHLHQHKKTLDYMDALSAGYKRRIGTSSWWIKPFVSEESKRLLAYENLIFEYFDQHTIISAQDRELIMHPGRKNILVVPNGVDAHFFSPSKSEKKFEMVFTGNMSYPPNVECAQVLVKKILPLVHQVVPGARLLIAGATPDRQVLELASDTVKVTGWLDDIRDAYSDSKIFIAPMKSGSGLQNKLLEAMSMGMPCITSPLAANAIGAKHGSEMLIHDDEAQIASAVVSLLADMEKSKMLGNNAREFVLDHFTWESSNRALQSAWKN